MLASRITPSIEVTIGRETRLYHAFVTTAPARLDAPATVTLHTGPFSDVSAMAAESIACDPTRAKSSARLVLVDAIELEAELQSVRAEMARHERASHEYEATGLQILELAQSAYSLYVAQNPLEQARLLKTLLSNCSFDRGSLSPSYIRPFDVFATGGKTGVGSSGPPSLYGARRATARRSSARRFEFGSSGWPPSPKIPGERRRPRTRAESNEPQAS